jgi:hypothetical protein
MLRLSFLSQRIFECHKFQAASSCLPFPLSTTPASTLLNGNLILTVNEAAFALVGY